ncbi:YciI family protein [Wenzhouxiangella sp. EGI_FJ10305]|uniref:YciI family protein n=1 Tax=Wenzhouxiangella sp. EGI_FJ10305 TaxID=3243768 RepID=UPI0035E0F871
MKHTFSLILTGLLVLSLQSTVAREDASDGAEAPAAFDAELAAALGADAYGMARYVMVLLKAGDRTGIDDARAAELQRGHLENIRRLAEAGHLLQAGPFIDGGDLRGIFIFDVETVEAARELTASDPAIEAGLLRAEYKPWYGSAAIRKIGEIHERIARENP